MLFNSFQFLLFFMVIVLLYYILPLKVRWIMLLISSYIFYMAWNPVLILLLLIVTFVNYAISRTLDKTKKGPRRKIYLIISIIINFGILFLFKYAVFMNNTVIEILEYLKITNPLKEFDIILPMGISFYTFQAASYTIDIYRNETKAEKNFFKFSLFITYFPQLVAGPIERYDRLNPQLFADKKFDIDKAILGVKIILMGYFKKIVIADRVATIVNTIYNSPENYKGLHFTIATILFAFQIYCDFSGYSDIAIGCSKLLGIDLCDNFKEPYFSKSIREFWQRWHISLSTWFKDYLYIPLGGNKVSKTRHSINIFITFIISGLWHGANWTFVLWGALHGIYQITENIIKQTKIRIKQTRITRAISTLMTFIAVSIAWIFFRANTIREAIHITTNLLSDIKNWTNTQYLYDVITELGIQIIEIIIVTIAIVALLIIERISIKQSIHEQLDKKPLIIRWAFYYLVLTTVITLGVYQNASQFIYFQF